MANSVKGRKWLAAVGVDEYDDCISLSSGITIVLFFSWCSFEFMILQKYQYAMLLLKFGQKTSFNRIINSLCFSSVYITTPACDIVMKIL